MNAPEMKRPTRALQGDRVGLNPQQEEVKQVKHNYPLTVAAAQAESDGKFRLAEALATEIPPRDRGPNDETNVLDLLAEARDVIIAEGGEPRAVYTLEVYRETALWVSGTCAGNFQWLPDVSFTAHSEARRRGMAYAEFAALDNPTVRMIRKTTPDAVPTVTKNWSPSQKREAARSLLADPTLAREVIAEAIESDVTIESHAAEAVYRQQDKRAAEAPRRKVRDKSKQERFLAAYSSSRGASKKLKEFAEAVAGGDWTDDEVAAFAMQVDNLSAILDLIRAGINSGSWDDELAKMTAGE